MRFNALNQILCAALIDRDFCSELLKNPLQAVAVGYLGNCFELSSEEKQLLIGIEVNTIEEFATRVQQWIEVQRHKQLGTGGPNPQLLGYGAQRLRLEAISVL